MKKTAATLVLLGFFTFSRAQTMLDFADSIRKVYQIPELAFAVVSADSIFELHSIGVQRINTDLKAGLADRFHIGSNTKAITAFIAALLVEQGKINWTTKFFDLFPELKKHSKKIYHEITLENLLTFRGKLPGYTYTFEKPTKKEITGNNAEQRLQLAKYFLGQDPMTEQNGLTPSNADYILAGLMLEKATGKSYKDLVTGFGRSQGINFGFNYPNATDSLQPWGHDTALRPLPPTDNYKLDWLLSAGNINVSLPDYLKFIQLQLKGLKGNSAVLPMKIFDNLLFGKPVFAFGWFNKIDPLTNHTIAFNEGNAGAFISQAVIIKEADRAYIIFTNSSGDKTSEGIAVLQNLLQAKYGR